jgi:hypothetical protein
MNIRMISINGHYCYINKRTVIHTTGLREFLKYKFVRHTRVMLGVNLLSISRIDPELVAKVQKDAVRYTPTKVGTTVVSAVAELIFRNGRGRDAYVKELVKNLNVVSDGGMKF